MRVCHLPKSAKRMLIVELPISKSVVRLRQRSLMIEHRVGVSHVKPAFREVKLNRGRSIAESGFLIWPAHD